MSRKTCFSILMIFMITMTSSCGSSAKTNKNKENHVPRIEGMSNNVLVTKSGTISLFMDASGNVVPFLVESATRYALIFRENPAILYKDGKYHILPGGYKVNGYLGKFFIPTFFEHFGKFPVIEVISIERVAVDK